MRVQKLLWIEDDADVVKPLKQELEEELGWHVHNVVTGEEAIEVFMAECDSWDLVLLDFRMPIGVSDSPRLSPSLPPERVGVEVLKFIRHHDADLPVIILSGIAAWPIYPRLVQEAIQLGITAVFEKPVGLDTLIDAIEEAVPSNAESKS